MRRTENDDGVEEKGRLKGTLKGRGNKKERRD